MRIPFVLAILLTAAAVTGCAPGDVRPADPSSRFFDAVSALCGRAFEGRVVVDVPPSKGPNPFADKTLVMHVRDCSAREIRIPFHVGTDRSRTWVLTKHATGLRLKHDHRHEDGSADAVTMYGGDTADAGTPARQQFPVDEFSRAMFVREGLTASVTNTWALEIDADRRFVYELSRPGGRLFRVEFDLARAVAPPPAPWGSADRADAR